ncbi:MAG: CCA tRNA nucleotidyltransferase [Alphaproteobacteria bacterium]|nr:CCA tRNA nucleotidyltransferase [Alphaproteobacteria bacterium]
MTHALWMPDVAALARILDHQARLVGGCVRDHLLNLPATDWDIATPLLPEVVLRKLTDAGVRTRTIGMKFGTIVAVLDRKHYDITTLRADIRTDGRHAVVRYTDSYRVDARRRDFTINALYMDEAGHIDDFVGGRADLDRRLVRFIGDPETRIVEDYLRILRYFRFWSLVSADAPDARVLELCRKHAGGLDKISAERKREEMIKLMKTPRAAEAVHYMAQCGIIIPCNGADSGV